MKRGELHIILFGFLELSQSTVMVVRRTEKEAAIHAVFCEKSEKCDVIKESKLQPPSNAKNILDIA